MSVARFVEDMVSPSHNAGVLDLSMATWSSHGRGSLLASRQENEGRQILQAGRWAQHNKKCAGKSEAFPGSRSVGLLTALALRILRSLAMSMYVRAAAQRLLGHKECSYSCREVYFPQVF
jgi:hypothetical protein